MSLVSIWFLIFLAACVLVYYLLPGRAQWVWLLFASLVFYGLCSYGLLLVPLADALIVFIFGKLFETKKNKLYMLLELALLIGILFVFKYAGWLGTGWRGLLTGLGFGRLAAYAVPLGISYFTIMGISYSVDVFRGTAAAEKNYGKLLLYMIFFPIVTQGPICRYEETVDQLTAGHRFRYEALTFGIQRMIWGFFKKLVIAERLAVVSSHLTEGWGSSSYSGAWVIASIAAFSFRLYMDFSGCIDIVIGTAEIFGIRLPENFNHSYLSKTIPEFWRRWHITLGTWLRDYVMYSFTMSKPAKVFTKKTKDVIGRKAAATIITCIGTLLVWLVYALWHDISAVFLLSGAYFALLIILSVVLEPLIKKYRKRFHGFVESIPYKVFMTLRTMLLSMVGAFFVFMPSVADGAQYLGGIFRSPAGAFAVQGTEYSGILGVQILGLDFLDFVVLVLGFALWILISRLHAKKDPREWLAKRKIAVRWVILLAMVLAVVLFGIYGGLDTGSFVYQGF